MLRHTWIQWNSKAKQGERDFTLKRKGTRDYTRSVKKSVKKEKTEIVSNNPLPNQKSPPRPSDSSGEYIEPYYFEQQEEATLPRIRQFNDNKPLRLTSLVDSLEPSSPTISVKFRNTYNDAYKTNLNPLSRTQTIDIQDSSNSEGYGTFRKGPYTIPDSNITHVCHRRFSQSEDATEL